MTGQAEEWRNGFLAVGNHPALDLLNTALVQDRLPVELLPDTAALERWISAFDLVAAGQKKNLHSWIRLAEAERFLLELRDFRERLRSAVLRLEAGKVPEPSFLLEANRLLTAHPVRMVIVAKDGALTQERLVEASLANHLWSLIAQQTLQLFTATPRLRLRKCESCIVHFLDTSKKGSRRWCSMNLCGNREKVATYQRRLRGAKR